MVMTRRGFLKTSAASAAAAALLAGCGGDAPGEDTPDGGDPLDPDAGFTPACEETEDNILGPFYKAGAPERNDLVEDPKEPGVRLRLSGTVFTREGETCTPAAGALLDIWQANAPEGDDPAVYDQVGFRFRGKIFTDAKGRYELFTIIPGNYLNGAQFRPAHIHVTASGDGIQELTTQLYFEGDPYNDIDPFIHEALIMPLEDDGQGGKRATFDFVLRTV